MSNQPPPNSGGPRPRSQFSQIGHQATQWVARILATICIMIGPGLLGAKIDQQWGTKLFMIGGFMIGMFLGTTVLIVMTKHFIPAPRGKPIPWEDEAPKAPEQDTKDS